MVEDVAHPQEIRFYVHLHLFNFSCRDYHENPYEVKQCHISGWRGAVEPTETLSHRQKTIIDMRTSW